MFNIPEITWTVTAVLVLTGSYHLLLVARSGRFVERVNNSLHAIMNAIMAAMLWNLAPSTMLAQIGALAAAALWFAIQAVARPEFKTLCVGSLSRLKCVYHSLAMAAGALMVASMGHAPITGPGTAPAAGTSHAHHMTATAGQATTAGSSADPGLQTTLATIFFGVTAIIYTVMLIRSRATNATVRHDVVPRMRVRAALGTEALGATVMALMFASLWA